LSPHQQFPLTVPRVRGQHPSRKGWQETHMTIVMMTTLKKVGDLATLMTTFAVWKTLAITIKGRKDFSGFSNWNENYICLHWSKPKYKLWVWGSLYSLFYLIFICNSHLSIVLAVNSSNTKNNKLCMWNSPGLQYYTVLWISLLCI
jgi:hypothetical protein